MIEKVFIDLDGVLTDFMTAAHEFHNIPYSYDEYPYKVNERDCLPPDTSDLSTREFWERLDYGFWANLPWTEDGKAILGTIEAFVPKSKICILTSPPMNAEAVAGKVDWIKKNLPQYKRQFLVGPRKDFCASPDALLIDDANHNIDAFTKAGGAGFLVPRKWNRRHNFKVSPVRFLRDALMYEEF